MTVVTEVGRPKQLSLGDQFGATETGQAASAIDDGDNNGPVAVTSDIDAVIAAVYPDVRSWVGAREWIEMMSRQGKEVLTLIDTAQMLQEINREHLGGKGVLEENRVNAVEVTGQQSRRSLDVVVSSGLTYNAGTVYNDEAGEWKNAYGRIAIGTVTRGVDGNVFIGISNFVGPNEPYNSESDISALHANLLGQHNTDKRIMQPVAKISQNVTSNEKGVFDFNRQTRSSVIPVIVNGEITSDPAVIDHLREVTYSALHGGRFGHAQDQQFVA
ncbi:MAG: hypothetical protein HY430_02905 [Candidatus Levybacteria bacterium]|nr:hypothetical protein [Candidatus Levybacteria bacterium]